MNRQLLVGIAESALALISAYSNAVPRLRGEDDDKSLLLAWNYAATRGDIADDGSGSVTRSDR